MKVGNLPFVAVSCLTIYECVVDVEDVVALVVPDECRGLQLLCGLTVAP
jgi:hypothetical protein